MPAADFCRTVRVNRSTLSHDSVTCNRSPEVSSIAFHAQPPDLPPVPLMDVGFAIRCSLARQRRPPIPFLSIGSRVCYTLLSDLASRLSPCALLSLRLHQAAERTCTSKPSSMLGTQQKARKLDHRDHSQQKQRVPLHGVLLVLVMNLPPGGGSRHPQAAGITLTAIMPKKYYPTLLFVVARRPQLPQHKSRQA